MPDIILELEVATGVTETWKDTASPNTAPTLNIGYLNDIGKCLLHWPFCSLF